jgi:hypothetical protein
MLGIGGLYTLTINTGWDAAMPTVSASVECLVPTVSA